jgi:hypothetical protein
MTRTQAQRDAIAERERRDEIRQSYRNRAAAAWRRSIWYDLTAADRELWRAISLAAHKLAGEIES